MMKTAWVISNSRQDWPEDIDQLIQAAVEARNALDSLENSLRFYASSAGPFKGKYADTFDPLVALLKEQLKAIDELGRKLGDRLSNSYWTALNKKFFGGSRLTKEEFYLFSALDMPRITPKSMGLSTRDEYEFFDMFCYEDDQQNCYINPDPMVTGRRIAIGRFPEELDISGLRPEQHDFFQANLPEIYARFKREPVNDID